jgi:predicted dienelactone hydrolase
MNAPGGPTPSDIDQQPGDVSFIIDSLLNLEPGERPFSGEIDPARIGVMGLSLGGLTSTLVGYHPRWKDERIRAVVSIAGPAAMFTRGYFLGSRAPFLMIAGTEDAIVDYETHAAPIPSRVTQGTLLTIKGGAHTSFVGLADPAFRFMEHPDSLGCESLTAGNDEAPSDNPFAVLGGLADGINPEATALDICTRPLGSAIHPGRQHMITQAAVVSFFLAQFGLNPDVRRTARDFLNGGIARDFPEVSTES